MKKIVLFSMIFGAMLSLMGAEGWKTIEEIKVSGNRISKYSYIYENILKVVNVAPAGKNETIINLKTNKIIMINHIQKNYQVIDVDAYIQFATKMEQSLKDGGYVNPEKVVPKITYNKKKAEKIGEWKTEKYVVKVDGRDYNEVWVAPSVNDTVVAKFRKKFVSMMPETLVKYRVIDEQIKDHFAGKGMIVKMIKIPINKKLPKTAQTLMSLEKIEFSADIIAIPKGYSEKIAGNASAGESSDTKAN